MGKIAGQCRGIMAQKADAGFQINQCPRCFAAEDFVCIPTLTATASAGNIHHTGCKIFFCFITGTAQPCMRHLHISCAVVFKNPRCSGTRILATLTIQSRRAIGVKIGGRNKNAHALELWGRGCLCIENIFQTPASMCFVKCP